MTLHPEILLLILAGFAEYALASWRTLACARQQSAKAAILLFVEVLLGLQVLRFLVLPSGSWVAAVAYSGASAMGYWLGCRKPRPSRR